MRKNIIFRTSLILSCLILMGSIIFQSSYVNSQESSSFGLKVSDTVSYSFKSTGAFIPYGNQFLHFEIKNIADPNNIIVDVLYGSKDISDAIILNSSVSAAWYILNNNSLQSNWLMCPLDNTTTSKIVEMWVGENLRNVSEYYNDVERNAIELQYSYEPVLHSENYSVSVRWLWDYNTGILLNNSIEFINTEDYSLSGVYEQYLMTTTVWELSTSVIPGFPLIWIGFFIIAAIFTAIILLKRNKSFKISQKYINFKRVLLLSSLILSSTYLLKFNLVTFGTAAIPRTMPETTVLLLTNNTDSALATSLSLDNLIHYSIYIDGVNSTDDLFTLDYSQFDSIIADSYLPDNLTVLHKIKSNINGTEGDLGLIFFGGNYTENALLMFSSILPVEFVIDRGALNSTLVEFFIEQSGISVYTTNEFYVKLFEQTSFFEIQTNDIQVSVSEEQKSLPENDQSMYVTRIAWESTPLLYERILTYAKKTSATTLVEVPDTNEPLIVTWDYDWDGDNVSSQIIYVSPGVATIWDFENGENNEWNTPFRLWPYFNYFVFLMVYDVKGLTPAEIETYAEWPWSPIPHTREAIIWMVFVGALWVFNFTLFFWLRKKSKNRDLAKSENSLNFKDNPNEELKDENPNDS